jgi:hypothetical protein
MNDEMGVTCSPSWGVRNTTFCSENIKGRDTLGDLSVDWSVILIWILDKHV